MNKIEYPKGITIEQLNRNLIEFSKSLREHMPTLEDINNNFNAAKIIYRFCELLTPTF